MFRTALTMVLALGVSTLTACSSSSGGGSDASAPRDALVEDASIVDTGQIVDMGQDACTPSGQPCVNSHLCCSMGCTAISGGTNTCN
jgi:hypothetical protein